MNTATLKGSILLSTIAAMTILAFTFYLCLRSMVVIQSHEHRVCTNTLDNFEVTQSGRSIDATDYETQIVHDKSPPGRKKT